MRGITGAHAVTRKGDPMSTIEESIDVKVPVSTASEQWTEFELFPSDAEVTFLELDEQSTASSCRWRTSLTA